MQWKCAFDRVTEPRPIAWIRRGLGGLYRRSSLAWWGGRKARRLEAEIALAHRETRFNPDAVFENEGLGDGCGAYRWVCESGFVRGLAGVRKTPTLDALERLEPFVRQGGKLVYLPMFAGIPTPAQVGQYAAVGYGSRTPADHLRGVPHVRMVDGDFFSVGRYAPQPARTYDFLVITWAGSIREKRWDLVVKLIQELGPHHTLCVVAYKGTPTGRERAMFQSFVDSGALTFINHFIPKANFSRTIGAARVMIVPSEWDNKPRIMDQALLCDVPIVVNERLYAGHYLVTPVTGRVASPDRLGAVAREVLAERERYQGLRRWSLTHHGAYNAMLRLSRFVNNTFGTRHQILVAETFSFMLEETYLSKIEILPTGFREALRAARERLEPSMAASRVPDGCVS